MAQAENLCDVLIIGGGPAGATCGALLAERGWKVAVIEKEQHPRFHIGESLLPMNLHLLERLGLREQVERMAMIKHGAQFVSPWHATTTTFNFAEQLDKSYPYAYQVRRSEFDHLLLENCKAKGAQVLERTRVVEADFSNPTQVRVVTRDQDGALARWSARFLVDASGRDTFLANQLGTKVKNKRHNSAAMFGHFTGCKRLPGKEEGNISVFWFDHGWFWFIPLPNDITSVGAVCWPYYMKTRKSTPEQFFWDTVKLTPALAERMQDAQLTAPITATGNYSYRSARMTGNNYIMLGDAWAFIDPIFSAGVYLAMNSAFEGADVVEVCLRQPERAAQTMRRFERHIGRGLGTFSWFIYRVTSPAMRDLFMGPRNFLGMVNGMISMLAGDVFGKTPIHSRLRAFKAVYYITTMLSPRRCYAAWRRRKQSIRDVQAGVA